MLSISPGMSPDNAQKYYFQKDPMVATEKCGEWLGKGAKALGLPDHVKKEDFKAVTEGRNPHTSERLVRPKITKDQQGNTIETHRACNDLTFSTSKSVSIAYAAGLTEVKGYWDASVKTVMQYVERHYSHYRDRDGIQHADNLVAGKFDHTISRAGDPNLHSHCPVMNIVWDQAGNWKANAPLNVFKDQKIIGLLVRAEMIHRLEEKAFEIVYTDREQLLFELKGFEPGGIYQNLITTFSTRRDAISAQVNQWREKGEHEGVREAKLHEMAALETRATKDKSLTRGQVQEAWNEGFRHAGTTPEQVLVYLEDSRRKNLETSQEKEYPEEQKAMSAADVLNQAAFHLAETEEVITPGGMLGMLARISGGRHSLAELSQTLESQKVTGLDRPGAKEGREICTPEANNGLAGTIYSITGNMEVNAWLDKIEQQEGIRPSGDIQRHDLNELPGGQVSAIIKSSELDSRSNILESVRQESSPQTEEGPEQQIEMDMVAL